MMQKVIEENIPLTTDKEVIKLSILVSCACVLQVVESFFPHPIPGVRFGLANMITLIALVDLNFKSAFNIALLRTIISSIILGTFLTPAFILSFSGSLISIIMMALFYRLSLGNSKIRFSLIGISVIGSLSHNLTQIVLVYLLFIRSKGILYLLPWLVISSIVMGIFTGLLAIQVCKKLELIIKGESSIQLNVNLSTPQGRLIHKKSLIHSLPAQFKILFVLTLAILIIIFKNYYLYTGIFFGLIFFTIIARLKLSALLYNLQKTFSLILLSFFLPIIFVSSGNVLLSIGPIKLTQIGLITGTIFTVRIILLYLATSLLALTTSPHNLTKGLQIFLSPFRIIGISPNKLAQSLTLSWSFFPILMQHAKNLLTGYKRKSNLIKNILNLLSDLITDLYAQANQTIHLSPEYTADKWLYDSNVAQNNLIAKKNVIIT